MQAHLKVVGKVAGVGYISDMTFGVTPQHPAAKEQGVSYISCNDGVVADLGLDSSDSEGA